MGFDRAQFLGISKGSNHQSHVILSHSSLMGKADSFCVWCERRSRWTKGCLLAPQILDPDGRALSTQIVSRPRPPHASIRLPLCPLTQQRVPISFHYIILEMSLAESITSIIYVLDRARKTVRPRENYLCLMGLPSY